MSETPAPRQAPETPPPGAEAPHAGTTQTGAARMPETEGSDADVRWVKLYGDLSEPIRLEAEPPPTER